MPNSSNRDDLGLPESTEDALVRAAVYISQLLEANRGLMERIDWLNGELEKAIGNPASYAAGRIRDLIAENAQLRSFGAELAAKVADVANQTLASPALADDVEQ